MMLDEEERTMPPTVLGLEKARQRGQVARSGELTFAAVVLAATGFAAWSVPRLLDKSRAMLAELLGPANVGDAPGAGAWPSVAPVVMELAMLLAGPSVSLPAALVLCSILGVRKTLTYVLLVILMATASGLIFGAF